jgi:hypothetical protein
MNAAKRREVGHVLAGALLRGTWEEDGMVARDGPGELDRAHVLGRIAWVESLNPARGAKLRRRAAEIDLGLAPLPDSG